MSAENVQIPADGDASDEARAMEEYNAALAEALGEGTAPDTPAAQDQTEQTDEGSVADPAPAEQAAVDVPADGSASPANETPIDDIWSNAPPELKDAYEKAQRDAELRVRSANGRVLSMQRQIEALSRQQQGGDQQGQQPEQSEKSDPSALDAALQKLQEDYPELAAPLSQIINGQKAEIARQNEMLARLSQGVQTFEQSQAAQAVAAQEHFLTQQHPDWQQVAADERFAGWLQDQPLAIQQAMHRNFNNIVDGRDAALVIGSFKRDMGIGAASPAAASTPTPTPTPAQMSDKRQRQLDAGRDAGRSGAPIRTGPPPKDDHDASFEYFMSLAERQG